MIIFNKFTTLLLIFIYKITEARFVFPKYFASVTGILRCQYTQRGNALILMSNSPSLKIERKPISVKFTQYEFIFHLVGKKIAFNKPHFYFKIIHTCTTFEDSFAKISIRSIPTEYVTRSRKPYFFDIGTIELSQFPGKLVNVDRKLNG